MKLVVLGAAVVLLVLWLFVRRRGQSEPPTEPAKPKGTGDTAYHAVSLKIDAEHACNTAKEMIGRRFLSNAAPRLPLPGCNALECRCQFTHHKDRRTGKDRRSPFVTSAYSGTPESLRKERREREDRRKGTDLD